MRVVFDVHNEFGRLLDETLFKREIAVRCRSLGMPVAAEFPITLEHDDYRKSYFIDLLFCYGHMVEAKTVERLTPAHRSQSLNYLFLTGLHHGRLLNLRPERVEHEFVSTRLTPERRRDFTVQDHRWVEVNPQSKWLKEKMIELLGDWGAYLDLLLYREAVTYFLGGASRVCNRVNIYSGDRLLGSQETYLLTNDTAFELSAVHVAPWNMEEHQRRFLAHTRLRYVQWINFNRSQIEFTTLCR
jgi:GxxExxY protein